MSLPSQSKSQRVICSVPAIGKGAFGVVWLAERRTQITTTTAAVKIPFDEDINIDTIKNEADVWVRASGHPNVLPIIEAEIYGEHIIIASEYASGGSLASYLKQNGKALTTEDAVEIVSGILAGLEHLHSRNIIHRDLKPANILFQGTTPRLADFGISRVFKSTSQSSNVMGTPTYMAPEAFDGKRNEQTDIWSVGVIFYELLTGRLPYDGEDLTSLIGAILTRNPAPLPMTVPKPLQNVITCALARDVNIRYKSAFEMRAALRNPQETDPNFDYEKSIFTVQSPKATTPPQYFHPPTEKKNNTPHFVYAIAGLFSVMVVVGSVMWINSGTISNTNAALTPQNSSVKNEQAKPTSTQNHSVDQKTSLNYWEGSVSATNAKGVRVEAPDGRKLMVEPGDELEIHASGIVQVRSDGLPSDANGEKGYRDPYVDSPYYDRVGGLEMWIGYNKEDNRYFVGTYFKQKVNHSGIVTLRVVDALSGFKGTGSFRVTVRKLNK